jgi:LPXTG-site transpeptidase (sortase) family protein
MTGPGPRWTPVAWLLTAVVAVLGGGMLVVVGRGVPGHHAGPLSRSAVAPLAVAASVPTGTPLEVRISRLGLDTPLIPIGLGPAGELVPPDSPRIAGWYAAGTRPGEIGPAVIAGHVDSRVLGPGVFFHLRELQPGDEVQVVRPDDVLTFRVTSTKMVAKGQFPTDAVYGPTPLPTLWLITCGGEFDRAARSYESNVIVRTILVESLTQP